MHNYFAHSPKRHLEVIKLVEFLKCKGNKIFENIKTCWISMFSLSKRIFNEYKTLVVKLVEDSVNVDIAKTNYEFLCDPKTLLSLFCIIPLLELVQGLSKFAQSQQTFICDFIFALKLYEVDFFTMYCEFGKRFFSQHFNCFQDICEHIHEHLCLIWWKELTTCIEYAAFFWEANSICCIPMI